MWAAWSGRPSASHTAFLTARSGSCISYFPSAPVYHSTMVDAACLPVHCSTAVTHCHSSTQGCDLVGGPKLVLELLLFLLAVHTQTVKRQASIQGLPEPACLSYCDHSHAVICMYALRLCHHLPDAAMIKQAHLSQLLCSKQHDHKASHGCYVIVCSVYIALAIAELLSNHMCCQCQAQSKACSRLISKAKGTASYQWRLLSVARSIACLLAAIRRPLDHLMRWPAHHARHTICSLSLLVIFANKIRHKFIPILPGANVVGLQLNLGLDFPYSRYI